MQRDETRRDAAQRDATRRRARENIRSGWHKSRDERKRNETPSARGKGRATSATASTGGKRRVAKGRRREREEKKEEEETEGQCTKSACKRANYELVRRRPLRVATNKRPSPFCRPEETPIVLTIAGTPSRDFSAAEEEEKNRAPLSDCFLSLSLSFTPSLSFRHRYCRRRRPFLSPFALLPHPSLLAVRKCRFFVEIRLAFDLGGSATYRRGTVPVRSRPVRPDFPGPAFVRARANRMPIVPRP